MRGPVIQISKSATHISERHGGFDDLRKEFDRAHGLCLPQLLEPKLIDFILRGVEVAEFVPAMYEGIGTEYRMVSNRVTGLLEFVMNDLGLFAAIRRITGCESIGSFAGRVYRMVASAGHYDRWHDDAVPSDHRIVGVSINLGMTPYEGGVFQMRKAGTEQILFEYANTGLGDALVFQIAPGLLHRVTEVNGAVPKTAFAGWFRSEPLYRSLLESVRTSSHAPR